MRRSRRGLPKASSTGTARRVAPEGVALVKAAAGPIAPRWLNRAVRVLLALVAVTAVWGVTFVQVKDAVELYPLFPFLALRFGIAAVTLALPGAARVRGVGRDGAWAAAAAGVLLAGG